MVKEIFKGSVKRAITSQATVVIFNIMSSFYKF